MTARQIPDETMRRQARASDPLNSAWVSAHAGSGKTHVLSQRVIRLLLRGVDPARILCLTYTRAAAANMSSRVFERLAEWTQMPDAELKRRIEQIEGGRPVKADLERARTLFATALETPGGLKVQTIHAFCESVLHQFPLEANIAAHFQMLDKRLETALVAEARRDMITGAGGQHDSELAEAFAIILERGGEFGLDQLLAEIVGKRDKLAGFIARAKGRDGQFRALFDELGLRDEETVETIAQAVWPLPGFSPAEIQRLVAVTARVGGASVEKYILPHLQRAIEENDPVRRLEHLARGLLKSDGKPFEFGKGFTKAIYNALPALADDHSSATGMVLAALDRIALLRMAEGTRAALIVADRLIRRYEQLKAGRGFLDFNDLINRTARLLLRKDAGAWVQYKLDQGIDHILVDEAQDTSPEQWAVVRALAGDFFSGAGARSNTNRTIFAVGDEKQSIYSFQGASPQAFGQMKEVFRNAVTDGGKPFHAETLDLSFRSTQDVLEAVDHTFRNEDHWQGVASGKFQHNTIRYGEPGYVEVWPYVGADKRDDPEDWRRAIDHAKAPAELVAEQVARKIKEWIDNHDLIHYRPKPGESNPPKMKRIAAGDIMVLVRKRDRFVNALSRKLKGKDVAVAGADRLLLAAHIAVKDLMALGRYLALPQDDLSLAAVLKSPLFDVSEDQLFHLSFGRPAKRSLDEQLRLTAKADPHLEKVVAQLDKWSTEAAFKPVFEFYSGVLARDGGRRRFIGRLGPEAGDIVDEFLSFCLAEEAVGLPGLEDLLTTLETASPEVKREMDQHGGGVRILTVHASKGLEAPIVFLVDSGGSPAIDAHIPRLIPFTMQGALNGHEGFLWRSSREVSNETSKTIEAQHRQAADEEYRRLFYVGMTRAEEHLIVCGYYNIQKPKERTWMKMLEDTLGAEHGVERFPHPVAERLKEDDDKEKLDDAFRFRVTQAGPVERPKSKPEPGPGLQLGHGLLSRPLPPQERLPRPLSPSHAALLVEGGMEPIASSQSPVLSDLGSSFAIARGLAMHKMLQILPDLPVQHRTAAADRYLARFSDWPAAERAAASASVFAILNDPQFAPLFSTASRAEVGIAGQISIRGVVRPVSGQVDRLAVTPGRVLIVDYKTNRPPPPDIDVVPEAYILQMALYAELLKSLYPDHSISAALLFTETPALIEIPPARLAAMLARLTQA